MYLMDDDFDEEQQVFEKSEWQPKSPFGRFMKKLLKILKKLPKYIFFVIVTLVWVVIFATIALRSNDGIVKTPILSDKARTGYSETPDRFDVYEIHTSEYMNNDGTIQLIKNVYADNAHELEVGLRIKGHVGETLYCTLEDDNGNKFDVVYRVKRERDVTLTDSIRYQYVFERISFGNVYIDVSKNIINRDYSVDISGEFSKFESDIEDYSAYIDHSKDEFEQSLVKNKLYFKVYASEKSETPLFSCVIYDDDTPLEQFAFRLPDDEYISQP